MWKGPRPLVTPANFQQDGTDATLTGVVVNAGSYFKYEFEFHGMTDNSTAYFQDLGVGCTEPPASVSNNWLFYPQFNGTLTNLATGETFPLEARSHHLPQVGQGASLLDNEYGISFWFEIPNTTVIGDVNLALRCVSKH